MHVNIARFIDFHYTIPISRGKSGLWNFWFFNQLHASVGVTVKIIYCF
ncbi:MAG: hypothetical protein UH242_03620 [Methanobrevibacter sp.]|nr:hypothetical protein [Methanobrevibacter sp.]